MLVNILSYESSIIYGGHFYDIIGWFVYDIMIIICMSLSFDVLKLIDVIHVTNTPPELNLLYTFHKFMSMQVLCTMYQIHYYGLSIKYNHPYTYYWVTNNYKMYIVRRFFIMWIFPTDQSDRYMPIYLPKFEVYT